MVVVIYFEYLKGRQNEMFVKEFSVAAKYLSDSYSFASTYSMILHGSDENGFKKDGHIDYFEFYIVVSEAVCGFAHLYVYGVTKCKFLSELLWRPILNLQDFNSTQPSYFNHQRWCSLHCDKFPYVNCVTKLTHFLYNWLM